MKTKIRLYILSLMGIILTSTIIYNTYALFETNATSEANLDISKWVIRINNLLLNESTEKIVVDKFTYTTNDKVSSGYIAPGRSGYTDLVLDPTETEVAVKYEISFDTSEEYSNIIYNVTLPTGYQIIKTGENTYTGIMSLDDIKKGNKLNIRVNVEWDNDDTYNKQDTELGTKYDNSIKVPIEIKVTQYLGEEIKEYKE